MAELDCEESRDARFNDALIDDESTATTMTNSDASVMMSSSSSKNRWEETFYRLRAKFLLLLEQICDQLFCSTSL